MKNFQNAFLQSYLFISKNDLKRIILGDGDLGVIIKNVYVFPSLQLERANIACLRQKKVSLPRKLRLGNTDAPVYMPWKWCLACNAWSDLCGEKAEKKQLSIIKVK